MLSRKYTLLAVILILSLVFSALIIGCEPEEEVVDEPEEEPVDEPEEEPEEVWPEETIRIVVPYNPGGGVDRMARTVAPYLQDELGVPIVVENRPGGGGIVGTESYLGEPADGSMILHQLDPYISSGILRGGDFDYEDFSFLANFFGSPQTIFVRDDSPFETLEELMEGMQEEDLSFSYIPGSFMLLGPILLGELVDIEPRGIPYDGGGPCRTALVAGDVDFVCSDIYATMAAIGEDSTALAAFAEERDDMFLEVPTVNEELEAMGIDEQLPPLANNYYGMINRDVKENYPERYEILVEAYRNAFQNPELLEQLEKMEMYPNFMAPDEIEAVSLEVNEVIQQYREYWVDD